MTGDNAPETSADPATSLSAPSVDGAALAQELTSLTCALEALAATATPAHAEAAAQAAETGTTALLVARVVQGLTPSLWNAFVREHPEAGNWFALPVSCAEHPNLLALSPANAKGGGTAQVARLICQETGLLLPEAFMKRFARQADESRRTGADLVCILFELVDDEAASPELLAQTLRALARGCDVCGRMTAQRLALFMPGMGALRARAFAERVMVAFVENRPQVFGKTLVERPLRAGLACFDTESAPDAARLLADAEAALEQAKPGDAKTFRKGGEILDERKTQVQASEKQFLFFGAMDQ